MGIDVWLDKVFELAQAANVDVSKLDYSRNTKRSQIEGSALGEKTKESIIDKFRRKIEVEGRAGFIGLEITDFIRGTMVVADESHIPGYTDLVKGRMPGTVAELSLHPKRGYRGFKLGTNHIDGLCAELQIVDPTQYLCDQITNKIYERTRAGNIDPEEAKHLDDISRQIYSILWQNTKFENTDVLLRSRIMDYGGQPENDLERLKMSSEGRDFVDFMSQPIRTKLYQDGKLRITNCGEKMIEEQATYAQEFARDRQEKFNKISEELSGRYNEIKDTELILPKHQTVTQWYAHEAFWTAIGDIEMNYYNGDPEAAKKMVTDDWDKILGRVEERFVRPMLERLEETKDMMEVDGVEYDYVKRSHHREKHPSNQKNGKKVGGRQKKFIQEKPEEYGYQREELEPDKDYQTFKKDVERAG